VDDPAEAALMSVDCNPRVHSRMADRETSYAVRTKPVSNSASLFERSTWYRKCSSNDRRNVVVSPR
jgi:hypothetical protein